MNTGWIIPFIIVGGAQHACFPVVRKGDRPAQRRPWPAPKESDKVRRISHSDVLITLLAFGSWIQSWSGRSFVLPSRRCGP